MKEYATYFQDEGKWKECEFLTGEKMAKRATELLRENKRLNNRIDKAIEYIKNNADEIFDCTKEEYNTMCEKNMKMSLKITRLNNIINELEKDNKTLIEALESNDTNMTSNQQEIFDKYYLKDKNNGN